MNLDKIEESPPQYILAASKIFRIGPRNYPQVIPVTFVVLCEKAHIVSRETPPT